MIPLTKKQLEQIRQYIATYGIRTTDFPDTSTVTADDYIAIVQGGVNKKVQVSDLFDPELLPSLIVDINIKDNWADITDGDSDSALSARLGKQLKDAIASFEPTTVISNWSDPRITNSDNALSSSLGLDLYNRIQQGLTVVDHLNSDSQTSALSARQGKELNRLIGLRPTLTQNADTGVITASWTNGTPSIKFYNQAYIDSLPTGSGGATALSGLTDVNFNYTDTNVPSTGDVLKYNGSKWVPGTAPSTDTWRPITVGADTLSDTSTALSFSAGTGIGLEFNPSTGVLKIKNTGGDSSSSGGYIGTTEVQGSSMAQALEGLTLIELVSGGQKKIYFGDKAGTGTPYIELVTPLTGDPYFHFSHGIASDSFVSAYGYNNAGGGGGGSAYLYGLLDIYGDTTENKVKRLDSTDYTYAQVGDALVLGANGKWGAAPVSGGSSPSSQVQADWSQTNNAAVDFIKNKPVLHSVATSGNYNDLTNPPTIPTVGYLETNHTGDLTPPNAGPYWREDFTGSIWLHKITKTGNWADLEGKNNISKLYLGDKATSSRKVYNATADVTFTVTDLINNVIGTTNDCYLQIGQARLRYNNGILYFENASGGVLTIYATGGVTAGASN